MVELQGYEKDFKRLERYLGEYNTAIGKYKSDRGYGNDLNRAKNKLREAIELAKAIKERIASDKKYFQVEKVTKRKARQDWGRRNITTKTEKHVEQVSPKRILALCNKVESLSRQVGTGTQNSPKQRIVKKKKKPPLWKKLFRRV